MASRFTVVQHRKQLDELREETETRLSQLESDYDALAEVGTDVGSGDDEGGSESDGTFVERDRIRAQIAEERQVIEEIEKALVRAQSDEWKVCTVCGGQIGLPRLEALPTTTMCVTCKATRTTW